MGRLGSLLLQLPSEVCSCPEAKVELLIWLDFCQYLGGRVVLSGDVPGSRAPATLEALWLKAPPASQARTIPVTTRTLAGPPSTSPMGSCLAPRTERGRRPRLGHLDSVWP